jgi:hypothetical protein
MLSGHSPAANTKSAPVHSAIVMPAFPTFGGEHPNHAQMALHLLFG